MSRLIHRTTSLCRVCKEGVPAEVVARGDAVWLEKVCPDHGRQEVCLSDDADWYERTRALAPRKSPPRHVPRPVEHGCPFDCGACESHEQKVRLPVVTVTSACNLDCPICYVHNRNDGAFHMALDEFQQILGHLQSEHHGDLDLINFTGGEPLLHPQIFELIEMSQQAGIHRVSVCTNGLLLAKGETGEALVERLARLGARIALSFDTFEAEADQLLQGAALVEKKLRCLDLLEKYDVDTTLIPVATRGVNDHELGRIIDLGLSKRNVRHVEVHTMTYTGQGGVSFPRSGRISMHEVLTRIESSMEGRLRATDFVASPCAHSLCYQIAYLLVDPDGGPPVPFARFVDGETLRDCLSEHLYLEPTARLEAAMQDAITRLWSEGDPTSDRVLGILKRQASRLFPTDGNVSRAEALRRSEAAAKAVYIHSHMDEETFDTERIAQCCDSNCYADGTTIPVCAYNILYRDTEPRFMKNPRVWGARKGGYVPVGAQR